MYLYSKIENKLREGLYTKECYRYSENIGVTDGKLDIGCTIIVDDILNKQYERIYSVERHIGNKTDYYTYDVYDYNTKTCLETFNNSREPIRADFIKSEVESILEELNGLESLMLPYELEAYNKYLQLLKNDTVVITPMLVSEIMRFNFLFEERLCEKKQLDLEDFEKTQPNHFEITRTIKIKG